METRACPPEDCGSVPGYEHLLYVMANPSDPEYQEVNTWLGEKYDPEAFSPADINPSLKELGDAI